MKPITRQKTIALDGIEFTLYTQRFPEDNRVYAGGWAVDKLDGTRFAIWPSEQMTHHDRTWETWTQGDKDEDNKESTLLSGALN